MSRIVFPVHLPAVVSAQDVDAGIASKASFKHELKLVSGHVYVVAWYYAMSEALEAADVSAIAALWQCGLTVTYHVRKCATNAALAEFSIEESETRKTANRTITDSFPVWARKILVILEEMPQMQNKMQELIHKNFRFNAALVNRNSYATLMMFQDKFNQTSVKLMESIQRAHGREAQTLHAHSTAHDADPSGVDGMSHKT